MNIKKTKYELQHLISGESGASYDALIQTIARHLKSGKRTSPLAEEKHENKTQETQKLIEYIESRNLFLPKISKENFISSGVEQRVYIKGEREVIKLNDSVYYASWEDYFHNLLLHNYFFSDTAYSLLGFHLENGKLHSVVQQPFVKTNNTTNLSSVKKFMTSNGFNNTRRHDYHNQDLGIIVEDLHDENVLTHEGVLYFIDTVFYVIPNEFWKPI